MTGRVSNPGSTDLIMCVNPLPNFIIGYAVLAGLLALAVPYVFLGRFHKASYKRERRALLPIEEIDQDVFD